MLTQSLQTLGGSGYLQDYPIEQYVRDVKIDSLYEGTTAIQALDLFFRKVVGDRGAALDHLLASMERTVTEHADDEVGAVYDQLAEAIAEFKALLATMQGWLDSSSTEPAEIYRVGLSSVRFLEALGTLLVAWRLIVNAERRLRQMSMLASAPASVPLHDSSALMSSPRSLRRGVRPSS